MGNGEAKELICTTHGHELRGGSAGGREDAGQRGIKRRKKWDNCNSIYNNTYFKKKHVYKVPPISLEEFSASLHM